MIKIGFIGTHGVGKTTTCYDMVASLKKLGYNACLANEVARMCPFPINKESTIKTSLWIFSQQLKQELEIKTDILICDRTVLDVLVYSKYNKNELFLHLSPFIKEYMKTYDLLFYIKPVKDFPLQDGIRSIDKTYRDRIDKWFDYYLRIYQIKSITTDKPLYDILQLVKEKEK